MTLAETLCILSRKFIFVCEENMKTDLILRINFWMDAEDEF